jgi:hypothetical protein
VPPEQTWWLEKWTARPEETSGFLRGGRDSPNQTIHARSVVPEQDCLETSSLGGSPSPYPYLPYIVEEGGHYMRPDRKRFPKQQPISTQIT